MPRSPAASQSRGFRRSRWSSRCRARRAMRLTIWKRDVSRAAPSAASRRRRGRTQKVLGVLIGDLADPGQAVRRARAGHRDPARARAVGSRRAGGAAGILVRDARHRWAVSARRRAAYKVPADRTRPPRADRDARRPFRHLRSERDRAESAAERLHHREPGLRPEHSRRHQREEGARPSNRGSVVLGSVAYFMDRYGYEVLPLALRLLAGETLPPLTVTHPVLITAANIFQEYPPFDVN